MSDFTRGVDKDAAEDRGMNECGCADSVLDRNQHAHRAAGKTEPRAANEVDNAASFEESAWEDWPVTISGSWG